jgi:hypothetical protein
VRLSARAQWAALTRYWEDGDLAIHKNISERAPEGSCYQERCRAPGGAGEILDRLERQGYVSAVQVGGGRPEARPSRAGPVGTPNEALDPRSYRRDKRPRTGTAYDPGRMFWFSRKRLVGSYLAFSARSRW